MSQKKNFKIEINPAMQFISAPLNNEETRENLPQQVDTYKLNPIYIEKRCRRLQILLQPSLYNKIKLKAEAEGCSVNETIHHILDNALQGETTNN